jgi:hypothetical protein
LLESPPILTETTPEKGIKDFNRQYLKAGMWPSKGNHDKSIDGFTSFRSLGNNISIAETLKY